MKKLLVLTTIAILVAGLSTALMAQGAKEPEHKTTVTKTGAAEKPGALVVDEVNVRATVKAVDHANRAVTLALPGGEVKTFTVAKEAVNFPQVKVGDEVKASYVESLAVFVHEANEKPSADETTTVALAPKGAKPGGFVANTKSITAKVTAIDHKTRMVTLTGPEGNSVSFKAGPDVKRLDEIKQGDSVTIRYTEALLLDVVAAKPATEPKKDAPKK